MIPTARCSTAADLGAVRSPLRTRERPPVPYTASHFYSAAVLAASRRIGGFLLPKTAPFSSSVAFLTPPTFPAPAPRKRFFDLIPTKILGFRTRKGRLPRRQYLARARLEFRAGLRVVVSSRARAFGISCGLLAGGAVGWLAALAVDGLRCACAPARHGIPARACAFGISCARPAGGAGGWLAVLPTAGAVRRPADRLPAVPTAAPIGAAHPDRLPPVDDLPPRPPAAPVCRSAAGQAGAAAEGIYRARYRPRIS